jgi:hypothetical protein
VLATKLVTVTNTGEGAVTVLAATSDNAQCTVMPVQPTSLRPRSLRRRPQRSTSASRRLRSALARATITVTTNIPTTDRFEVAFRGVAPEVALDAAVPPARSTSASSTYDAATEIKNRRADKHRHRAARRWSMHDRGYHALRRDHELATDS